MMRLKLPAFRPAETGAVTFDVLLQAQRNHVTDESNYYRAAADCAESIALVHYRKGSLLNRAGVDLAEDSK
jgi:hypothetical protein